MSRSRKRNNVSKIKGKFKEIYWRVIRRRWKQEIKEEKELTNEKNIVNDYDYTDWRILNENPKYKRK